MIPQPPDLPLGTWLDLGDGHELKFMTWAPDFDLPGNAKFAHLVHLIKTQPVVAAVVRHLTAAGPFKDDTTWQVHSWVPLTLSPSLLAHCPCNDHGYIRDGRWVRA